MTLFRTLDPIPGESLPGLIARAAAHNLYPRAFDVLIQAGLAGSHPQAIAGRSPEIAPALSRVLGTSADNLVQMFHRPVGSARLDFFGAKLRGVYYESTVRRVSPRALRASPHVRAIWHVRPISFDPGTHELLLSACPVCGKSLGFSRTSGVAFCDFCAVEDEEGGHVPKVDLRDFPQPLVEVEDFDALHFVTGLIDPDPAARSRPQPVLTDALAGLERDDLFDLAIGVAAALMRNALGGATDYGARYLGGIREVEPAQMARAGRALLDWPKGFVALCEQERDTASQRMFKYGIYKELGAIKGLSREKLMAKAAKDVLNAGIETYLRESDVAAGMPRNSTLRRHDRWVSAKVLAQEHKVNYVNMRRLLEQRYIDRIEDADAEYSPILVDRTRIEPIIQRYKMTMSEAAAARSLGVPLHALRELVDVGHFFAASPTEEAMRGGGKFLYDVDLAEFREIALDFFPLEPDPVDHVSFTDALLMFPAGRRPWLPLIEDICFENVHTVFHKAPGKFLFFNSVSVKGVEARRESMMARLAEVRPAELDTVTIGDARLMLGLAVYDLFAACVRARLLSIDDDNGVDYRSIVEFGRRFIQTNEIAVRARVSKQKIASWLRKQDLAPVHDLGMKGGMLFDRETIEPLLEMKV